MHALDWPKRSVVPVLALSIAVIVVVDALVSSVDLLPLVLIPVIASAVLASPKATVSLAAEGLGLGLVSNVRSNDFSETNTWVLSIVFVLSLGTVILLSVMLAAREGALLEREAKYRVLAENASDLVLCMGEDGTITWISPSASHILGERAEALVGTRFADLVEGGTEPFAERFRRNRARGQSTTARVRILRDDEEPLWMDAQVRAPVDREGATDPIIVSLSDVDAEVRVRQQLRSAELTDPITGALRRSVAEGMMAETVQTLDFGVTFLLCVGVLLHDRNQRCLHVHRG